MLRTARGDCPMYPTGSELLVATVSHVTGGSVRELALGVAINCLRRSLSPARRGRCHRCGTLLQGEATGLRQHAKSEHAHECGDASIDQKGPSSSSLHDGDKGQACDPTSCKHCGGRGSLAGGPVVGAARSSDLRDDNPIAVAPSRHEHQDEHTQPKEEGFRFYASSAQGDQHQCQGADEAAPAQQRLAPDAAHEEQAEGDAQRLRPRHRDRH
mmetsp:Transcript_144882/g.367679  ORF Transcript_144882/g.367679 Transcript_144882/m.367679 type:complete len:213 (+) Transcript_144882:341-979(+)